MSERSVFVEANRAFREGRFEDAASKYLDAIAINPGLYVYYENLAEAFERLNKLSEAVEIYRQSFTLCPYSEFSSGALRRLSTIERTEKSFFDAGRCVGMKDEIRSPLLEEKLRGEYVGSGLHKEDDSFVLYRIIGNDLHPRHVKGQSRENLEFILRNEPTLERCEKRWLVNRIVDSEEEGRIIDLLDQFKQSYAIIPFNIEEYGKVPWDMDMFPCSDFFSSDGFLEMSGEARARAVTAAYRLKNNYVMNNNGARNFAIRDGRARAKWILPWDGNCFVGRGAWSLIQSGILNSPYMKYSIVPMARLSNNCSLFARDFVPDPVEEPQIAFRRDAREVFNEDFCYGRRPKVEMLWRLGVPGKWDSWSDEPWDQPRSPLSDEAHQFSVVGWVARLSCGTQAADQSESGSKHRWKARQGAILETIDQLERAVHGADAEMLFPSKYLSS